MSFNTAAAAAKIKSSHVAVVGGSIAGCATAIALRGVVDKVTVFERSPQSNLQDRGLGIGLPTPTQEFLTKSGYLSEDYRYVQTEARHWFVKDDTDAATNNDEAWKGRRAWTQPIPVQLHNWGLLWKELRARVDDYRSGVTITNVEFKDEGVELIADGTSHGTYDFVVGADGSSSFLRKLVVPNSQPNYAGYVLWRGSYPLENLKCKEADYFLTAKVWTTVGFENGHGIFYAIPSSSNENHFLVNWAVYTHTPPGMIFETPAVVRDPPEQARAFFHQTIRDGLPPYFLILVEASLAEVSVHPIFDESPEYLIDKDSNKLLLVGDSGAILRPHTASGTTKALKDAMAVGELCKEKETWQDVCAAYQHERKAEADNFVKLGGMLGFHQVLKTPQWNKMSESEYAKWYENQTKDQSYYLAGDKGDK